MQYAARSSGSQGVSRLERATRGREGPARVGGGIEICHLCSMLGSETARHDPDGYA